MQDPSSCMLIEAKCIYQLQDGLNMTAAQEERGLQSQQPSYNTTLNFSSQEIKTLTNNKICINSPSDGADNRGSHFTKENPLKKRTNTSCESVLTRQSVSPVSKPLVG